MNKKAEKILNTTVKLFLQNGIKKVTMDDIAEQAMVSKVTVYKYFSDKDTLYYEVGKHILSYQISKMNEMIGSEDILIKRLYYFIDVLSDFMDTGYFDLCSELIKFNDRLSHDYESYLNSRKETLLHLIDEGIQSGLMKQNLDRQLIFHYINMGIFYYQQNAEYRNKIHKDSEFQKAFMMFQISNIFADAKSILNVDN